MLRSFVLLAAVGTCLGYSPAGSRVVARSSRASAPTRALRMDETLFDNILDDSLEVEGAEKPWLSEAGWALYLDKQGQSYNLNKPVSEEYNFFTGTVFSSPFDVIGDFFDGLGEIAEKAFISKVPAPPKVAPKKEASKQPAVGGPFRALGKPGEFNLFGAGPTDKIETF